MSPREVQGLQALAENHGGSLTINPETGLPEAGILDKLLPTIIGAGLTFFGGVPPNVAAMIVGGVETVRTGDLGKGLRAGLGAYGGANLTAGLTEAGASTIGAAEAAKGLTMTPELMSELSIAGEGAKDTLLQQQVADKMAAATPYEKLSSGFDAFGNNPMGMAKSLAIPAAMAFGPAILAGANVQAKGPQTTTKPGMIRPYSYDPYGGTYTAGNPYEAAPTKAAGGGLMGLAAGGMAGYEDDEEGMATGGMGGMFNFAQQSEPVVRMATGGVSDADIFKYFQTPNLSDTQIAADMQKYGVSAADIARATGTQDKQANYEQRFVNTLIAPGTDSSEFLKATSGVGLQGQALTNALNSAGVSQGAQYALTQGPTSDVGFTGGIIDASTGKPVDLYKQLGYTAGALPGDQAGFEGLYGNINYVMGGLQNLINSGKMSVADAQNAALAELARTKVSIGDVKAATGKDFGNLFTAKEIIKPITTVINTGGGGTNTQAGYGTGGSGYTGSLEDVLGTALPPGVSGAGITTVNPNGTITTRPNIPGIPEGGFTGMTSLRDAYEKGGGSLGVNKNLFVPKTQDELFARYKNTGGSKAALDYLMGKTPYSPTPYTPTGEIQKPYWESVGRFPENRSTKKYVFVDGKYQLNPDYVKPPYVLAGEKAAADKAAADKKTTGGGATETTNLTNQDEKPTSDPGAGNEWLWDYASKKWYASPIQVAAAGGLMAMARGGMAQQFDLGGYSDGGRLLRGPGDGVSDSIPATIGNKRPARLADGEFVVPARIVSELGNGSTEAGARKLYAMMDRVQKARRGTVGKGRVAKNSRSDKYLPA
jgi:hypothetical protein